MLVTATDFQPKSLILNPTNMINHNPDNAAYLKFIATLNDILSKEKIGRLNFS